MKEKNFTFTESQVNLLCESIIAKMCNNNHAFEMVTNNAARIALGTEQRELNELLDYLTNY